MCVCWEKREWGVIPLAAQTTCHFRVGTNLYLYYLVIINEFKRYAGFKRLLKGINGNLETPTSLLITKFCWSVSSLSLKDAYSSPSLSALQ